MIAWIAWLFGGFDPRAVEATARYYEELAQQ